MEGWRRVGWLHGEPGSALFVCPSSPWVRLRFPSPYYWIRSNSEPAGWTLQLHAEWVRASRAGRRRPPELELEPWDRPYFLHVNTRGQSGGGGLHPADKVLPRLNLYIFSHLFLSPATFIPLVLYLASLAHSSPRGGVRCEEAGAMLVTVHSLMESRFGKHRRLWVHV